MVIAGLLLAGTGVAVKLVGTHVSPMTMAFYRVFFGFLFVLIAVPLMDKKTFKIKRKDIKNYLIVSVVMTASFGTYVLANTMTTVQNAVLLNYIHPFFVLVIAYFLLNESINRTKLVTIILAIAAIAIINPFSVKSNLAGDVVAVFSALAQSVMIVLMRREDRNHGIGDVFWFFLFSTIMLLPIPFIFGFGNPIPVLPYLLILGIVCTGLAYLLFNLSLERLEAEVAATIAMLTEPIAAVMLAAIILGETIGTNVAIGGALLIAAGVYLETHTKKLKA